MTALRDAEPAAAGQEPGSAPQRRRRLLLGLAVGVGVLLLLLLVQAAVIAFGVWSGSSALAAARHDATTGQLSGAHASVARATSRLRLAQRASGIPPITLAAHLPAVGTPFRQELDVLTGVRGARSAAEHLLSIADLATGSDHKLFHDGTIDLVALQETAREADAARDDLAGAQARLRHVVPQWYEPGLAGVLTAQEDRLATAAAETASAAGLLDALPGALGASGPRRYVVTVLNPGELRFSGGAPLSLAEVTFTQGRMAISRKGATYTLTDANDKIRWAPLPGDPWLAPGKSGQVQSRLVNATFAPDWRTAGEELLRAYEAQFGVHADGVVAVDPVAMARVLDVTGPVQVKEYGTLTGSNLVQKLLVDAYDDQDVERRRAANEAVFDAVLGRLTAGRQALDTVKVLAAATKTRHVLGHFRDPGLGAEVVKTAFSGALPTGSADFIGVYTQNTNASKVDVFQSRVVTQDVQVTGDGSADVVRVVDLHNAAPPYDRAGQDPGRGYNTSVSAPLVALYVPATATGLGLQVDGKTVPFATRTDGPHTAVTTSVVLPAGGSSHIVLTYHLATARGGYAVDVAAQPLVRGATLRLSVRQASDAAGRSPAPWSVDTSLNADRTFGPEPAQR